ncbi:tetrahydromethanopterin S-methyltransferase subunit B [Methanoculleus taiwanensis]|uniref:Tetrahydromethanopterin S-methyltransferase subunit B n=1 Tax=Methanoculleus taiwanensis TaxID=1550565 RepID=A0A498H097_9EURY|nr:tetrahydromethanopterin S-methyltransferase subunit B [Methanoculleus taiwanensis]RXE55784.1 tetrahydromethanopterin S-methyltransferase subunit B [Methanoculleus taiwanensis]
MGYILVLPEFGLVADPIIGLVTTAGESYAPVLEQVAELEKISEDLIGMLSGEGNFLASFPNREGVLKIAGSVTAFWYGMAIGLLIAGVVVFGLV